MIKKAYNWYVHTDLGIAPTKVVVAWLATTVVGSFAFAYLLVLLRGM